MSEVKFWNATLCKDADFRETKADDETETFQSHLGNLSQSFHLTALIGSGASMGAKKDFAGPSMTDLVDVVKAIDTYPQVLQWTGHTKDPGNIEHFLSDCERLQELPTVEQIAKEDAEESSTDGVIQEAKTPSIPDVAIALTASQKMALGEFLSDAKREIRKRCDFLDDAPPAGKSPFPLESHEKFLRCFGRRSGRKSRLKIFTTNYDLCFEKAAGKTNFVLLDGFSFTFPRRFSSLNYGLEIAQKSESSSDSLEPIENLAHLFKLHGSVNWVLKEGCVEMSSSPGAPCIIHPSISKYQQAFQQPYLEMISHYLEAMRKLDQTLIVVGFGFADAHLVAPIEAALASSSKFRLVVVDPDLENRLDAGKEFYGVLNRWKEQKDPRITLVKGTFSEFMGLVPELHQKSEAEQLADAVRKIAMPSKVDF